MQENERWIFLLLVPQAADVGKTALNDGFAKRLAAECVSQWQHRFDKRVTDAGDHFTMGMFMAQQGSDTVRRISRTVGQKNNALTGISLMQRIAHHAAKHIGAESTPETDRPALWQRSKLLFQSIQ
jgi:hypothetical protein